MSDPEYVAKYGPGPHRAADALIFRHPGWVCLIRRPDGLWAMPGGFLDPGESPERGAIREAEEETGALLLRSWIAHTEHRDSPDRDPRAHIVTTAHLFVVPPEVRMRLAAADDAKELRWWPVNVLPARMYADHADIVRTLLSGAGLT